MDYILAIEVSLSRGWMHFWLECDYLFVIKALLIHP